MKPIASSDVPVFIQALMPSLEDRQEPVPSTSLTSGTETATQEDGSSTEQVSSIQSDPLHDTLFENPFLKPAKLIRLK